MSRDEHQNLNLSIVCFFMFDVLMENFVGDICIFLFLYRGLIPEIKSLLFVKMFTLACYLPSHKLSHTHAQIYVRATHAWAFS